MEQRLERAPLLFRIAQGWLKKRYGGRRGRNQAQLQVSGAGIGNPLRLHPGVKLLERRQIRHD